MSYLFAKCSWPPQHSKLEFSSQDLFMSGSFTDDRQKEEKISQWLEGKSCF